MYVVMEEQIKMDSFIEENQGIQEEQFWWMNIDSEAWNIVGGKIGETKAIPSLDIQSWIPDKENERKKKKKDSNKHGQSELDKDRNTILWLFRYFKDNPDNPHFGIPIAPQEMAISLLDSEDGNINRDEIEKAKKRIKKYLKPCLNHMGIIKDPDVVLTTASYRRHGGRQARAWLTVLDQQGKPVMGVIKNKYRHEVSSGERVLRQLSQHNTFVHYFYRNRPSCIPTQPYTTGHEYEDGYVQNAPKEDPEINYDIKSVSPYPDFRTGDTVFAYNVMNNRIIGLLKVLGTKEDKVTLQIEQIYDNPVFIVDFGGMKHLTQIRVPFKLTLNEFKAIKKGVISKNPKYASNNSREYSKEDLLKSTFIDVKLLDDIDKTLEEKKCIILQGAPGVGKTFLAERIAFARMKEKNYHRIEFVQFHPNYTYEDFIIGYKPRTRYSKNDVDEEEIGKDKKSEGGFALKDGVFMAFCHVASTDTTHDYYFIIDEINRGYISKIFGEAFSLIEKGYRGKSIKLAYSQKKFVIPDNVYIIGLMNTADRSLAMIDFALRRRFAFFTLKPAFETDAFKNYLKSINSPLLDKIIQGIVNLNEEIKRDSSLGPGFCIGHSYFCFKNKEEVNDERLKRIIRYEIIPMLQEYWFDNDGKFKEQEKKLREIIEDDER